LRAIAAGAPATEGEWVDVSFALVATNLMDEQRHTKRVRAQRRIAHWALVGGAVLVALNALLCLGLLLAYCHAVASEGERALAQWDASAMALARVSPTKPALLET
jgi:hypothetical protein